MQYTLTGIIAAARDLPMQAQDGRAGEPPAVLSWSQITTAGNESVARLDDESTRSTCSAAAVQPIATVTCD
ncbi:hypothetical protein DL766_003534 [Monosporascus sp. MC13-8B]|nr:hypothetical protein DL763_003515 [Monosporascus cannonballus]RYP33305.1 hypothetical protein DL766_003534 [Monosporascus sp. MC13-8B]